MESPGDGVSSWEPSGCVPWCAGVESVKLHGVSGSAYAILGVDPGASPDEVRRAYRQRAKESHPDRHGGSDAAHVRWLEIQLAYEILSDPERRARHDRGEDLGTERSKELLERRLAQLIRRKLRLRRLYE